MDNEEKIQDVRKEKNSSGKAIIWVMVVIIVILAIATGALAYPLIKNKFKKTGAQTTATPSSSATAVSTKTIVSSSRIIDEGVTWNIPVKLDNLGLIKKSENQDGPGELSSVTYYKVGTMSDSSEIIDAVLNITPSATDLYRIIKRDGTYYKVSKNTIIGSGNNNNYYSEVGLKTDDTTVFKSLANDKTTTKGQTKLVFSNNSGIKEGSSDGAKIDDTKWGFLYKEDGGIISDSDNTLKLGSYYMKLNDSTRAYYRPTPTFMRDDGTLDISWSDQSRDGLSYQRVQTSGCGGGTTTYPFVANNNLLADKEQVASNAKVYFISDKNNPLDQYIYKIYKRSADPSAKSVDSFIENIGMLIWTDDYGDNIVYSNKDYSFLGECGKPVVYLYPTETTAVTVEVGAQITKSDPEYGSGWKTIASPDGKIIVDGKRFPYLFWEGLGLGQYPQITSGTVVGKSQVESTIKTQLTQIGLNKKEITDFLEFWLPKMPNTEYVRLTWLQNKQMNELAPLKITPKPDTTIRVFLDFAGLDQKIDMPAQNLEHISRNGFTAVEWGGLLSK